MINTIIDPNLGRFGTRKRDYLTLAEREDFFFGGGDRVAITLGLKKLSRTFNQRKSIRNEHSFS